MKKVIVTSNPYRDRGFHAARSALNVLKDSGVDARLCLPFEVDRSFDLPRDLRFSRLDRRKLVFRHLKLSFYCIDSLG